MLTARITPIAVIALISGVAVSATSARIVVFVEDDAPLGGDGLGWASAHRYLQDALIGAAADTEIHVAGGTYKPDQDEAGNVTPGERAETFQLISGVGLYGGYRGCPGGDCAGGDPDERDIELYETILSGDLLGNDEAVSCTQDAPDCDSFGGRCVDGFCIIGQNNNENSYHVTWATSTDPTAALDGFTVTAGDAFGSSGGGMYNSVGSPTLTNCTFRGNSAATSGGGMYNYYSSPTLTNCTFSGNSAGSSGGGMRNYGSSTPTLTNCTFIGNSANGFGGGGMENEFSSPTLTNCTFSGNSAAWDGGGMYNGHGSPTVTNCTFSGNSSSLHGGGMSNFYGAPTVTNCTFIANSAQFNGGGMENGHYGTPSLTNCTFSGNSAGSRGGGTYNYSTSAPIVTNCIFWGNLDDADGSEGGPFGDESAQIHLGDTGASSVNYTCIQGLIPGGDFDNGTNIGDDPLFVPGPAGCYYLSQTAAGQAADSPCVDTGDPVSPLIDGTTRSDELADSGFVDMGYHYPITGIPLLMGDYDRDTDIDLPDFGEFQSCFTGPGPADVIPCCRIFDFEADSDVDLEDYAAIQTAWTGP